MGDLIVALPDVTHIFHMTDSTGMFQHSQFSVPDPTHGYTTDDNARALVMAVMLYERTGKKKYLDLAYRYLSFLLYAEKDRWFRNFMDYDRRFTEERGSQDCFGRCIGSLGFTAARKGLPQGLVQAAAGLLLRTLPGCRKLEFLRSKAYAVIGLSCWKQEAGLADLKKMAEEMAGAYEQTAGRQWQWFEDTITYCNAALPWAMLAACETTGEKRYEEIGLESLEFLWQATYKNGVFRPVGCAGWFPRGGTAAEFDQQPVEACGTLLACLKAYRLTQKQSYLKRARTCLEWYTGRNTAGVSLIDPETGGCKDGIFPQKLNENEGAESLIAWIIGALAWADVNKK